MKFSVARLVDELGPQLATQWLDGQPWVTAEAKEQMRETLLGGVNSVVDMLQHTEIQNDQRGRAKFITELAVHLLHAHAGEPSLEAGKDAVNTVAAMLAQAEKLCSK